MGSILPAGVHSLSNSDSLWTHYLVTLHLGLPLKCHSITSSNGTMQFHGIMHLTSALQLFISYYSHLVQNMISSLPLEPFRTLRFPSCCFPPQVLRQLYPSISPIKANYKLPEAGGTSISRRGNR